jgi:hypothetical protein
MAVTLAHPDTTGVILLTSAATGFITTRGKKGCADGTRRRLSIRDQRVLAGGVDEGERALAVKALARQGLQLWVSWSLSEAFKQIVRGKHRSLGVAHILTEICAVSAASVAATDPSDDINGCSCLGSTRRGADG